MAIVVSSQNSFLAHFPAGSHQDGSGKAPEVEPWLSQLLWSSCLQISDPSQGRHWPDENEFQDAC